LSNERTPRPIAVLISGRGSNMRALVEHSRADAGAYEVVRVLSDKPAAAGLSLARNLGVAAAAVPVSDSAAGSPSGRAEFDRSLAAAIDECAPALIVLAGFMRILSPEFVNRYAGRIMNIHPSLLPKYPGLHTHRAVLAAGDPIHGATVHFVTAELDGGPPIVQAVVQVRPDDEEATLAARVQAEEHHIYPLAVGWYCEGRLRCREGRAWLDGAPLLTPVQYVSDISPAGALPSGAPQGRAPSRSRRETGS
jgi:phosphoribosylglycinamide formyltransferase-1